MPNPQHLRILQQGVDIWNHWRVENPHLWPDLREAGLTGLSLPGIDLGRALLNSANLGGADLRGAIFQKSNLFGADLSRANLGTLPGNAHRFGEDRASDFELYNADPDGVDLREANLMNAILVGANLRGALLRYTQLPSADLSAANLENASATRCNFSHARLSGAVLRHMNLGGSDLSNCILSGVDFTRSMLSDVNLSNSIITDAILDETIGLRTQFCNANLVGTDLKRMNLIEPNLQGAILEKPASGLAKFFRKK